MSVCRENHSSNVSVVYWPPPIQIPGYAPVDRAWRKAIQQHVGGRDLQLEVYHMLRSLLQEIDQDAFHTYLPSG